MPLNRMKFMNTYIDNVTEEEAIAHIDRCITNRVIGQVIEPNVDQIVRIEKDPYFKRICENAELLLADGHPLLWIAKYYGKPIKEKIAGSDLMPKLCELAEKKGYSIFLLGAAPGIAQIAADKLKEKFHDLKVSGVYSPPVGFEHNSDEIKKINQMLYDSHADMLFVGLGAPKQEIIIYENKDKYQIPMSFSVGATLDFIAGKQKRAPRWMTNHGLEWFYRFLREPKRMFKRYFVDDIKIFKLVLKYRKNTIN